MSKKKCETYELLDGKIREKWRNSVKDYLSHHGSSDRDLPVTQLCEMMAKDGVNVVPKTIYDAIREKNPTSPRSDVMDRVGEWIDKQ